MRKIHAYKLITGTSLALLVAFTAILSAEAGQMAGPSESLISLKNPEGRFVSLAWAQSDRDIRFGQRGTPLEVSRITAATGVEILPFLSLRAEAGTVGVKVERMESNSGFEWGFGARAALWEVIIEGTPALPRRKTIRLELDAAYREASMKMETYLGDAPDDPYYGVANKDDYLKWSELTLSPVLRYTHDRTTESVWNHRLPSGISAYIGPYYSKWDLDQAPSKGKGIHDMGMRLGADLRIANGWLVQLDAILYDGSDHRYTIGMGYTF